MLCVHGCTLAGLPGLPKHRWDVSHEAYSGVCPHCNMYCGTSSVKMINQYLAGNLSRDRIMFEVAPGRMHGLGWLLQTERLALAWATNLDFTAVEYHDNFLFDSPWSLISDAIVKGIPVIVRVSTGDPALHHYVAVCGARIADGKGEIHVCNPMLARSWWQADALSVVAISFISNNNWEGATGRMQEASYAEDADEGTGDGVIRFDEEQRFHDDQPDPLGLDPSKRDSDDDGVLDKDEVRIKYGVQ